jgi:two-component system, NarL family, response regulator NreC
VPRSILLVDDHEVIRRQLRLLFDSYPEFTVCGEAVHGVDAIEKAQQLSPDLIILDLSMPEMNGLEAASAIRCMMPDVPLFLLTAHYSRELELTAFGSGICAVFSKHDDLDSLVARARLELNRQEPGNGHSSTQGGS